MRETSANEPLRTHRNQTETTPKPGSPAWPGKSVTETYLLVMRCPVYKRRDSHFRAFVGNLRTWGGDAKGKGASGRTREAENTEAPPQGRTIP